MNGVLAVFYRDCRQRITNIAFVFWDLFVPIAYLLLFGLGFEVTLGAQFSVQGAPINYLEFFLPGVLAMATFTIAMNTAWTFFMDKDSGIFYELLTYPITRRQLLLGKVCFNVLLSSFGALLMIGLGALILEMTIRWTLIPVALLLVMGTTAGWFFLFSILAVKLRRMDSFNTVTSAAYILLMFLSTIFYPLDRLPAWFQVLARMNPMTWQADVLRFTLTGLGSLATVLLELAGFIAFTLVCLSLSARTIDRAG
jgi:ABC-2 type transport system permease protein